VLKSLKRFFRDYLEQPEIVRRFRFPAKPIPVKIIPSTAQIQQFYNVSDKPIEQALFLFYATSGLRRSEVLNLQLDDIDIQQRMIFPKNRQTRTKRRWMTCFNEEAKEVLHVYLAKRTDSKNKLFRIRESTFLAFWKRNHKKTGIHITPKVLREWFCAEMGRLGVPDRFVDAFCERMPKSVLAKYYSDYSPEKPKAIYENADLTVLDK
jgi:integrase